MASFADRLAAVRAEAGLSQYALAKRAGVSKQALSLLELGEREPNWETVQRLALALGVDCRAFVDTALTLPPEGPPAQMGRPRKTPDDGAGPSTPIHPGGKPGKAAAAGQEATSSGEADAQTSGEKGPAPGRRRKRKRG